ncbi:hypothetical protein ACVWZA_000234 [Sphingomonas sp. UYAg733]
MNQLKTTILLVAPTAPVMALGSTPGGISAAALNSLDRR